ncbi:conserved unknown protein [Ectocarpus siliculosus]|uniref:Cell division control protein 45 n=1 Tax=Ectocarpus siliculosus TaxID=2880 RepID=D7FQX6_ECTSI|nr:conserved unknown protein [Ectocarpus siliculosus]|eukprot:CBJ26130.1 conserved unknown protein [Ectocarpus siliculosus]
MLLDQRRLDFAYEQIVQDAAKARGACTVLVFVAPNCDAMCACRILSYMLRADAVSYKIKPVAGYGDISAANEELIKGNEDIRSVVMINCGAICNVVDLLSQLSPEAYVYIVDSNRPVHLANVYPKKDRVVVFVDEENGDVDNIPSDGEGLDGNDETSDESDADSDQEEELASNRSDESDDDDSDDGEARPEDKENTSPSDGLGQSAERGKGRAGRKRKRQTAARARRQAHDAEVTRRQRIRQYYNGATHGSASAVQLFAMAMQLNKDTNDLLWLAIVGLTDQYIHQRIDQEIYHMVVAQLQQHVVAKNSKTSLETSSADGKTLVPVSEMGRITCDMEFRFMLHRHWSLYESMYFSNFVASKLNVWNSNGRHRLEEFLAKMGFSLEQCKQKYPFMSCQLRKRLRDQIEKYAEDYGLQDVFYGSYQRYCGFKNPLSAADMVYCITALAEHKDLVGVTTEQGPGDSTGVEEDEEGWIDSFNTAYDALSGKSPMLLKQGLSLSMSLQRAVVQQAVTMMEKRSLTLFKHFRYAFIRSSETDERLFTQPMALRKLAAFLIDVHRENGRWAGDKARPLVIMAERVSTYLVVGVTCPKIAGTVIKNRFGACFQLAAQQIQARARHDGFEASVMEISKEDVHDFIQALHDTMSA